MQGLNIQFVRKTTYRELQTNSVKPEQLKSVIATRNINGGQSPYSIPNRNFNNFKDLRRYSNLRADQRRNEFIVLTRSDRKVQDFGNQQAVNENC